MGAHAPERKDTMAKLALVVEKLDAVPEALRAAYVERDGKFHLDADLPDTEGLEATVAEERRLRDAAEKLMRKAVQEADRLKNAKKASDAGLTEDQLRQLRADVRAEVEAEFAPVQADAEKAKAENRTLLLDNVMQQELLAAGFLPTRIKQVWQLHGGEFDLTDDRKPMVKGKPGIEPKKHVEALKKLYPEWVQGTRAGGGGAAGGASKMPAGGTKWDGDAVLKDPMGALRAANAEAD